MVEIEDMLTRSTFFCLSLYPQRTLCQIIYNLEIESLDSHVESDCKDVSRLWHAYSVQAFGWEGTFRVSSNGAVHK